MIKEAGLSDITTRSRKLLFVCKNLWFSLPFILSAFIFDALYILTYETNNLHSHVFPCGDNT
jgi:hypothetical protein